MSDDAAVARLQTLLRIPTISRYAEAEVDRDQFERFISTLAQLYPFVHSRLERERVAGYSLLFRWPGRSATEPTVLMAHYDVVAASDAGWKHPPFAGELSGSGEERLVWGRGTLDDKGALVAILEAVESQLAAGVVPAQDVYLVFGHDEETASTGARAVVDLLESRGVRPALVLDEGGAIASDAFPGVTAPVAFVGVGEKAPNTFRLIVDQPGGHASTPPKVTATVRLAKAIVRLNEKPFRASLTPTTAEMLHTVGLSTRGVLGFAFRNARWLWPVLLPIMSRRSAELNAMSRTTQAVTMLEAGEAVNALAEHATATVNVRIAVDSTVDKALAHITRAIRDERVRVEVVSPQEPVPVSQLGGMAWELVAGTIEKTFPEAIVTPYLQTGATDSRHFTRISRGVYRFSPFDMTREERDTLHARNERMRVSSWLGGIEFYRALVAAL
ncbi:MAG: M20/M25/M40 family metallo-hydrolase [Rhodoglobus sp.]